MSDESETDRSGKPALPRPVQEHIGRQLRTALRTAAEKPTYLGETDIPAEFDGQIRRLEAAERGHSSGVDAVREALGISGDDQET
jgi:hypothetical protein